MTDKQKSSAQQALVQELLAAIEANHPVARGYGRSRAEPSFQGGWLVMDRDCAERVKKAAAALRESVKKDNRKMPAGMGRPSASRKEALVQELLNAIEANKPLATGTGRCDDVPCFDHHDREAEYSRPGWELVEMDAAKRVEKVAAAVSEVLADGV